MEYILHPLRRYEQLRAKAAYCLVYYANRYDRKADIAKETSEELRKLAAELEAFSIEMPRIVSARKRKRLGSAAACFIGLSNSVTDAPLYETIRKHEEEVKVALKLYGR